MHEEIPITARKNRQGPSEDHETIHKRPSTQLADPGFEDRSLDSYSEGTLRSSRELNTNTAVSSLINGSFFGNCRGDTMYNEVCVGRDTFFKVTQTFYLTSKGENTGAVANQGGERVHYTRDGILSERF